MVSWLMQKTINLPSVCLFYFVADGEKIEENKQNDKAYGAKAL